MRRRALLAGAGVGIGVSLAGCLSALPFVGGSNYDALEGEHEFDGGSFEINQIGPTGTWWFEYPPLEGRIELFAQAKRVFDFFEDHVIDDDFRAFVEDTAFESERLLFIGTHGNQFEYDQVMIRSLSLDGETLEGSAAAHAELEPADDALNYPIVLVRVTFNSEPADRAKITVISGGNGQQTGGGDTETYDTSIQET